MLDNLPVLTVPAVDVGEAGLYRCPIRKSEGVDAGVDRDISEDADVGLVDSTFRALGEERDEIVLDFCVIVTHLVGDGRQQDGIGLVECGNILRLTRLESRVPSVEE